MLPRFVGEKKEKERERENVAEKWERTDIFDDPHTYRRHSCLSVGK